MRQFVLACTFAAVAATGSTVEAGDWYRCMFGGGPLEGFHTDCYCGGYEYPDSCLCNYRASEYCCGEYGCYAVGCGNNCANNCGAYGCGNNRGVSCYGKGSYAGQRCSMPACCTPAAPTCCVSAAPSCCAPAAPTCCAPVSACATRTN